MKKFHTSDYYNGEKGSTAWFDDLEKAKEFAKKDYHNPIVTHTLHSKDAIAEAEYNVALTKYEINYK